MSISIVSTTAQLIAAISGAATGDTIELAPGTYSNVAILNKSFSTLFKGGPSQVYIRSEFSTRPAVITNMLIRGSSGLNIQGVTLSTATDPAGAFGAAGTTPFEVETSSNIAMRNLTVVGNPSGTLLNQDSGMYVTGSSYVSIQNSSFEYLHFAIDQSYNNHVTIANDTFNHLFDDGIRGGGTSNITITGNYFTNLHVDPSDTDHPDTIQFWTTNTTTSARNITITNNTYVRGAQGGAVQGIFIADEVGHLPYYNVDIENNQYTGALWNGITLYDVQSGKVENNIIQAYPDYSSSLRVYNSGNLVIENNKAANYNFTNSTKLTLVNNAFLPAVSLPGTVNTHFAQFADFAATPLVDLASAAPEPASWGLMSLGFGLMGFNMRRRSTRRGSVASTS